MTHIALALGFFVLVVVSHAQACRRGLIGFQMEHFFILCLFWAGIYFLFLRMRVLPHTSNGHSLMLTSFVLYSLLCLTYLAQCTTIPVQSPSLKIVSLLCQRPSGLTFQQLRLHLSDEELILSRLTDLIHAGYVRISGKTLVLTSKGNRVARIFNAYQRLIRRNMEN